MGRIRSTTRSCHSAISRTVSSAFAASSALIALSHLAQRDPAPSGAFQRPHTYFGKERARFSRSTLQLRNFG